MCVLRLFQKHPPVGSSFIIHFTLLLQLKGENWPTFVAVVELASSREAGVVTADNTTVMESDIMTP